MNDIIKQTENTRRALQEAIESAKEVIEQTLDLIERTQANRDQAELDSWANGPPAESIKRIPHKAVYGAGKASGSGLEGFNRPL